MMLQILHFGLSHFLLTLDVTVDENLFYGNVSNIRELSACTRKYDIKWIIRRC